MEKGQGMGSGESVKIICSILFSSRKKSKIEKGKTKKQSANVISFHFEQKKKKHFQGNFNFKSKQN